MVHTTRHTLYTNKKQKVPNGPFSHSRSQLLLMKTQAQIQASIL